MKSGHVEFHVVVVLLLLLLFSNESVKMVYRMHSQLLHKPGLILYANKNGRMVKG